MPNNSKSYKNDNYLFFKSKNFKQNCDYDLFSDVSLEDKRPWTRKKNMARKIQSIYEGDSDFQKMAERIAACSEVVTVDSSSKTTGGRKFKFKSSRFCRVRNCPVCQWRRSLKWKARFHKALPEIKNEKPTAKWLFLTCKIKSCAIEDLRTAIQDINKGWKKVNERKIFRNTIIGWMKGIEVTRDKYENASLRLNAMILVKQSYFGNRYVSLKMWKEGWKESLRIDYVPDISVKKINKHEDLNAFVDIVANNKTDFNKMISGSPEWFLEFSRQVDGLRFIGTGGFLKEKFNDE